MGPSNRRPPHHGRPRVAHRSPRSRPLEPLSLSACLRPRAAPRSSTPWSGPSNAVACRTRRPGRKEPRASIDRRRVRALAISLMTATLIAALAVPLAPVAVPTRAESVTAASAASRVIAVARAQLGDPWRYGATGPYAFDCSGLVTYAFRQAGQLTRIGGGGYRSASSLYAYFSRRGLGQSPWRARRRSRHLRRWIARRHLPRRWSRHQHAHLGRQDPRDLRALPGLHRVPAHRPLGSRRIHGTGRAEPRHDIEPTSADTSAARTTLSGHPATDLLEGHPDLDERRAGTDGGHRPSRCCRLRADAARSDRHHRPGCTPTKRVAGGRRSPHRMA